MKRLSIGDGEYPTEYPINGTWNQKIQFILFNETNSLTSGEIVDSVVKKEPDLERSKVMTSISATLSAATDKGIYIKEGRTYDLVNK